jgi:flagellar motor protein MotB
MGVLAGIVSLIAIGCQNKVAQENRALWEQNRELQARLASADTAPKADPSQGTQLQAQIEERDAKLAELQNQLHQPAAGQVDADVADIQTSYDKGSGKMTVAVPGDVLFTAGDATVRDQAKATLDKVALSLKRDYAGKPIHIEGHTDARPYAGMISVYSNWELSTDRANVARRLMQENGIGPQQVSQVRGFADQRLRKPDQPDDASNRRISVVVQYLDSPENPGEKPEAAPTQKKQEAAH